VSREKRKRKKKKSLLITKDLVLAGEKKNTNADRDEVLEGFGHLQAIDVEVAGVEKVVDPLGAAKVGLCLGNLIVVMGESQVNTPGMNVQLVTKNVAGHHGALNMPAGPPLAPGRVPERLPLLRLLPESKVRGRPLPTKADADRTLTLLDQLGVEGGLGLELGIVVAVVAVKFLGIKVHRALSLVRVPVVNDLFGVIHTSGNELSHPGNDIRGEDLEEEKKERKKENKKKKKEEEKKIG